MSHLFKDLSKAVLTLPQNWAIMFMGATPRERGIVIGLSLAVLAAFVFGDLAGDMVAGDSRSFDNWLLLSLRNPENSAHPLGPAWVHEMMRDVTALGSTVVLAIATIAVVIFLHLTGNRHAAVWVLVAVIGGTAISTGLKIAFDRPRPSVVLDTIAIYTASFPSGHAMMSPVVYPTLGAVLARTQADVLIRIYIIGFSIFLALIVGVSRVYLGVHWPTDVLAGWALGAAWAILCWTATIWLQEHGDVEPPAHPINRDKSGAR